MSKVFHTGINDASSDNDPMSWTDPYWLPPNETYWSNVTDSWIAATPEQLENHPLPDQETTTHAISVLEELSENPEEPFFLAVGYLKPHLPFTFPEEFLDFYPDEDISLPDNEYAPHDMPNIAWWPSAELLTYRDIRQENFTGLINDTLSEDKTLALRRAYYGAVSYIDALIGNLLSKLEEVGLADDTIIALWGDHGYQLGEHAIWNKDTNFDLATHAPMMIHVPGLTDDGIVSEELTEMVDLFPTIVEAAELPTIPLCPENSTDILVCTEGMSMMPLITNHGEVEWKSRVFSLYPRLLAYKRYMGFSMKTDRYRYNEWVGFSGVPDYIVDWEDFLGAELYDNEEDPAENYNLANDPDYEELAEELRSMLRAGWREALPYGYVVDEDFEYMYEAK